MPRKIDKPSSRHHVLIFDEDWEFLSAHFGKQTSFKAGCATAVRTIIHNHVGTMRGRLEQRRPPRPTDETGEAIEDGEEE